VNCLKRWTKSSWRRHPAQLTHFLRRAYFQLP